MGYYFALTSHSESRNVALRKALTASSQIFWETLSWFGLLAAAAAASFEQSKSKSLFEGTLMSLVAFFFLNAGNSLMVFKCRCLASTKINPRGPSLLLVQTASLVACYATMLDLWSGLYDLYDLRGVHHQLGQDSRKDFDDLPSYADQMWPLQLARAALYLQVPASLIPCCIYCCCLRNRIRQGPKQRKDFSITILSSLAFLIMWVDFVSIMLLRAKASDSRELVSSDM